MPRCSQPKHSAVEQRIRQALKAKAVEIVREKSDFSEIPFARDALTLKPTTRNKARRKTPIPQTGAGGPSLSVFDITQHVETLIYLTLLVESILLLLLWGHSHGG